MEVHFSPGKEASLREFAARAGKDPEQVVEEAVDRVLHFEPRFLNAVEQGRASARRGELLEHEEVVKRIEQTLRL